MEESRKFWGRYRWRSWSIFGATLVALVPVDFALQPVFDAVPLPSLLSYPAYLIIESIYLARIGPGREKEISRLMESNPREAWTRLVEEIQYAPSKGITADQITWLEDHVPAEVSEEEALTASPVIKRGVSMTLCSLEAIVLLKVLAQWIRENPKAEHYAVIRDRYERAKRKVESYHEAEFREIWGRSPA